VQFADALVGESA